MKLPGHAERTAVQAEVEGYPERIVPGTPAWDHFQVEHHQRYAYFAGRFTNKRVLDIACGVGYGSRLLAEAGAQVVGVDSSPEAIACAAASFSHPAVEFRVGDAESLEDEAASFDAVVSFETIEHLRHPRAFMREARRVLRPGGTLVCSTPNREWAALGSNPYHLSEMSYEEFRDCLGGEFEILELYHQSPAPAYLRHLELLSRLQEINRAMRFSRVLRLENTVRRLAGRQDLTPPPLSPALESVVPGDYVIEPFDDPLPTLLTFIAVARARAISDR